VGFNRNLILVYYFALVVVATGVAGITVAGTEPAVASVVATAVVSASGTTTVAVSTTGAATGATTGASTGFSVGEQATRAARINVNIVFTSFIKI
jgi:hypothetical protein